MVHGVQDGGLRVLRRRWRIVVPVAVLVTVGVGVVSFLSTPIYSSTATLVVNQPRDAGNLDVASSLQFYARTLVNLVGSQNVAREVTPQLSFRLSAAKAQDKVSFTTVNETQLLKVTAEDANPRRAQELANVWARTFTDYAARNLKEVAPASVSVADTAPLPTSPVRPRPKLYTAIGLVFGLLLGVGAAFLRERLDNRIRDAEHLTQLFGLPVLVSLPKRGTSAGQLQQFREAVGMLRTNLQFASDEPLTSISVTSSVEGEGKSTIVAELGRSFALLALADGAVLVVDADLRRPTLPERLGLDPAISNRRTGLSTYLRAEHGLEHCAVLADVPGLAVVPSGHLPPNPSTLLGFASSRELLSELARGAQVVIFDSPPVSAGSDAAIIATAVDGVLMVVDLTRASIDSVRSAVEQMRRVSAPLIGFVVNNSAAASGARSYYYRRADRPTLMPATGNDVLPAVEERSTRV